MTYTDLQDLVGRLRYKPGWSFRLRSGFTSSAGGICAQPAAGDFAPVSTTSGMVLPMEPLFLVICASTTDSSGGGRLVLEHTFWVPPEDRMPWRRWLLDRILDVERHEACEFFQIGGERPFYPEHGPGARLYDITERPPEAAPPVSETGPGVTDRGWGSERLTL